MIKAFNNLLTEKILCILKNIHILKRIVKVTVRVTKLQEIVMVMMMMMMMFNKNALMAPLVIGKIRNTERISSIARLLVGLCIVFYSRYIIGWPVS